MAGIQGLKLQWSCIAACFCDITSSRGACVVCEVLKLIEIKGKKRRRESHFFHAELCWCTRQEVGHTWVTPGWPCYAPAQGFGTISLFSKISRSEILTLKTHICTYVKVLCKWTEYLRHPGKKKSANNFTYSEMWSRSNLFRIYPTLFFLFVPTLHHIYGNPVENKLVKWKIKSRSLLQKNCYELQIFFSLLCVFFMNLIGFHASSPVKDSPVHISSVKWLLTSLSPGWTIALPALRCVLLTHEP